MSRIVAVRHGEDRTIDAYKTDDGRILTKVEAVDVANRGELEGVASFTTRDGDMSIRSNRGQDDYSLNELPEF
ncbi:MAG: DUF3892 domain-containing protein [Lachnospiraceae bacterium]|nr:DUF3892 domain-containing protein [Lachnospiraceae bacterium]